MLMAPAGHGWHAAGQEAPWWRRAGQEWCRQVGGHRVEWRTVVLAAVIHGGWVAVLIGHRALPAVVVVALLAALGGWFGSLQHEVIHRHPTSWRPVNRLCVALPLSLWVPFERYRLCHLAHHASDLTMPGSDPESFYCTPQRWASRGWIARRVTIANRTLLGRLTIGPAIAMATFAGGEARAWRLDRPTRRALAAHIVQAAVTVWLVAVVLHFPLWQYLVGFCYLGTSLTMLRSFAEHRAVDGATRSAVVRSSGFFGLLFLNNNLHHTHHARPEVPWYRLKALHAELGSDEIAANGAGWYRSYGELLKRYLLRPFCQPDHPLLARVER